MTLRRLSPIPSPTSMHRSSNAGMTVLEVVIALTVLALALTGIMSGVVNGDKARGKRLRVSYATMLAESEIERIRAAASVADSMADTTYAATVEHLSFEVQRTIVPNTETLSLNGPVLQEIDIAVRRTDDPTPAVRLRMVQGFERKE